MPRLENVDVPELPPGYVPLEVVAVIKCIDADGNPDLAIRTSTGVMAWEAIGMLVAASDMVREDMKADLMSSPEVPPPLEEEE